MNSLSVLDQGLEEFVPELSARDVNVLASHHIVRVRDVVVRTPAQLAKLRGIGSGTVQTIARFLGPRGLRMGMIPSELPGDTPVPDELPTKIVKRVIRSVRLGDKPVDDATGGLRRFARHSLKCFMTIL